MTPEESARYIREIADHWIALCGTRLLLSNAEFELIRGWRERDLPLRVVLRGINDAWASRGKTKPSSLHYCGPAVDRAERYWRAAVAES